LRKMLKCGKALSPVIATVILVAVTIVVAVSVAFWMGSIAGTYTSFEQVQITSAPVYKDSAGSYWNVTINLRNTGSADATIDNVLVNGKPFNSYNAAGDNNIGVYNETGHTFDYSDVDVSVKAGSSKTIIIKISAGTYGDVTFAAGNTIDIKLHSAAGKEYPQIVTLT